jgi:hypothetical protein
MNIHLTFIIVTKNIYNIYYYSIKFIIKKIII